MKANFITSFSRRITTGWAFLIIFSIMSIAQEKNNSENWPAYNRTNAGDRFSPLDQINKGNVSQLKLLQTVELGSDQANFQVGPVVIDGVMYFSTDTVTYAIDAATGDLKWRYHRNVKKSGGLSISRGVAWYDGKIIRGGNDLHVFALDAQTGNLLWDTPLDIIPTPGASLPMAPIAWNGMVFIGNAGGDQVGVTGHVYALDVNTGKQVWRYDVVPENSTVRNEWIVNGKQLPVTGGCFWTSFSMDNENGILYVPSGNPAPDFDKELRQGDNLYTNCIIALDAKTGKMVAYNQVVKDDYHDWDVTSAPVVLTTGNGKKVLASANKDGLLTIMDRSSVNTLSTGGEEKLPVIYSVPVTTRENVDAPFSRDDYTHFKPGMLGGCEWNGAAYHPELDFLYVGSVDWGAKVKLLPLDSVILKIPQAGDIWYGGDGQLDDASTARGWFYALDAKDGTVKWKHQVSGPIWSGVTPTAGRIVFGASAYGEVYAFDAENGSILWKGTTGLINGGGLVTYVVNGKQYVAVVGGYKRENLISNLSKESKILIFGL